MHLTLYRGARDPVPLDQADFGGWADARDALIDIIQSEAPSKLRMLAFAPHRLREPKRLLANVADVTALVLDVDHVADLDALLARVGALGVPALVYGSPSDDEAGERRVRIVSPTTEPIKPENCAHTRCAFAERLGLAPGSGVEEALDASRLFFAGRLAGAPARKWWVFGD